MPELRLLTLYLIRHGECEHNVAGIVAGHDDSPLTARGCEQARANGRTLAEVTGDPSELEFYASPLHRACRTMELLRAAAGLPPDAYKADRRLMELDYGQHTGLPAAEIRKHPDQVRFQTDPWNYSRPRGESIAALYRRVSSFLDTLSRNAVIVCHHGSAKMIRANYLNIAGAEPVHYQMPQDGILILSNGSEKLIDGDART